MPFWVCSKMLCEPERCKNSIWDYREHLRLPAWMWFMKWKSSEIKWNQMSALLYLCWTDRTESRSRDKNAWMQRSPVVNKKKCCERKKKEFKWERDTTIRVPARFPKEAPEKGTNQVLGEKESSLFALCEGQKIMTEVASLGEEVGSGAFSRDRKPRTWRRHLMRGKSHRSGHRR